MLPANSIERIGQRILDMRQLHTFRVVAMTKNFTRAATELGCCQSTVTVHIQALERELSVSLFERDRSSKTVALTDEGRRVLEYAERLLALANEVNAAVSSAARGLE
jgi:DNA-binding transcriptional LysR family regulator